MAVDNAEIARLITRYADLLEVDGANAFRIRAYRNAVRLLTGSSYDMAKLVAEGRNLADLPGIGKILADKITTIVRTGTLPQLAKLEERVPAGLADLMQLPGLGAKHVALLYHELGIQSLADLDAALQRDALQKLPGFGTKTLARLRAALDARPGAR
ncbi:MAG TPA: helix-hairpin-helix domain-containing protein [Rhodanobacteraceae bacterium]